MGRPGLARDVIVDQFQHVAALKGQLTGEQLVKDDAQGVEVGSIVDITVHAAGLLRRDIGQGADQGIVCCQNGHALLLHERSNAKVDDIYAVLRTRLVLAGHQNVVAAQVLVHHLLLVDAAQDRGHIHRQSKFLSQIERVGADQLGQRLSLNVFHEQHGLAFGALFGINRAHAGHVGQLSGDGIFIVQLVEV